MQYNNTNNTNNNINNINSNTEENISKSTVLKFISHFTTFGLDVEECFSFGNCYYFALVLYSRFKSEAYPCYIVYDEIYNHFGCKIGDFIYDISGITEKPDRLSKNYTWENWEEYKLKEPLNAYRVIRDCIMF